MKVITFTWLILLTVISLYCLYQVQVITPTKFDAVFSQIADKNSYQEEHSENHAGMSGFVAPSPVVGNIPLSDEDREKMESVVKQSASENLTLPASGGVAAPAGSEFLSSNAVFSMPYDQNKANRIFKGEVIIFVKLKNIIKATNGHKIILEITHNAKSAIVNAHFFIRYGLNRERFNNFEEWYNTIKVVQSPINKKLQPNIQYTEEIFLPSSSDEEMRFIAVDIN